MTTEDPIGTFWVRQVETSDDPVACVLIGEVRSGVIVSGMLTSIALNSSITLTARVSAVGHWGESADKAIWVECSDPDEASLLAGLNLSEEEFAFREAEPES